MDRMNRGNMVGWRGTFRDAVTDFRHATISTKEDWDEFTENTYTCSYKTGNWNVLGSENYLFLEKFKLPFESPKPEWERDYSMLTAFHTVIQKRLILDGMHRGFYLEKAYQEGGFARDIQVFEAIGPQVHVTFWYDFLNLVADSSLGEP